MLPDRSEDGRSVDEVESILKIHLKNPFVFLIDVVVVENGVCGMYNGFSSATDSDAKLKRRKDCFGISRSLPSDAFCGEASEGFTHSDGTVTARFFERGKKVASAEVRQDWFGRFAGSVEVDQASQGDKEGVAAV